MITIDAGSGWIDGVKRVLSPHRDARPAGIALSLIVVHGISLPPGSFGGPWIDEFFSNRLARNAHPYFETICGLAVSAHTLISRDGAVTQYVSFLERAWHAGESCHRGRTRCNDFSVGIELEGTDDIPYERVQYEVLGDLIGALRRAYASLREAEIVGHSDIAPQRKTDPGPGFDWVLLERLLNGTEC